MRARAGSLIPPSVDYVSLHRGEMCRFRHRGFGSTGSPENDEEGNCRAREHERYGTDGHSQRSGVTTIKSLRRQRVRFAIAVGAGKANETDGRGIDGLMGCVRKEMSRGWCV